MSERACCAVTDELVCRFASEAVCFAVWHPARASFNMSALDMVAEHRVTGKFKKAVCVLSGNRFEVMK